MEKKLTTPLNIGIILSLILVAISVVIYVAIPDMKEQQNFRWVSTIVLMCSLVFACYNHAKEKFGNVTFGNVFAFGFKTTAIITCFMVIFSALSVTVLFPEMKDKGMEIARQQMEEQGKMTETQIDQAIDFSSKFFFPLVIGTTLIGTIIAGAIASLIGAAIAKKNPNPTPFESDNLS
jgi:hypothetical protein